MRNKPLLLPILLLSLTVLACSALGGLGGDSALFKDDFENSNSGWSTFTSDTGAVEYANGEYVMQLFTTEWFVWGNPGESSLSNVHIEVTAKNVGGTNDTSFGIICNYTDDTHYYYMGFDVDGYYAIARYDGASEVFLTNNDQWAISDVIPTNAPSYRVGADCANGLLVLYVDGKMIDSVTDTTFSSGDVGLFAWSDQQSNARIQFDDFVVTSLGDN